MAASSALSPNVVKTALDDVFDQKADFYLARPDQARVVDSLIFNQMSTDRAAVIVEELQGTGYFDQKSELQNAQGATSKTINQNTASVLTFAQTLEISKELFDDAQHNTINMMIAKMARNARVTQERSGFGLWRNAFTATYGDGAALVSATHTLGTGATQSNLITPALSETALDTAIQTLELQKDQDGTLQGLMPRCLLVPPALYKLAIEITESELRSSTADNDLNTFSAKYGISVRSTPFISASETGSDTSWFLIGDFHGVMRYLREPISTHLKDWVMNRNHAYEYTARYREVYTVESHIGVVGSNGTT